MENEKREDMVREESRGKGMGKRRDHSMNVETSAMEWIAGSELMDRNSCWISRRRKRKVWRDRWGCR